MEKTKNLIRRTIFIFLKNYNSFTTSPLLLLLPFSASILFVSSQTSLHVSSVSLFLGFFSLLPLVVAKSSILKTLNPQTPPFRPQSLSNPLKIQTFHMGTVISLSAASKLLPFVSNHGFRIILGAVYYTIRTNAAIVLNLAFTLSMITGSSGTVDSIRDAVSLRIRESRRVLVLALSPSLGFLFIEALFGFRIVGDGLSGRTLLGITMEVLLISYLYSIIVVLETIACFLFVKNSRFGDFKVEGYCSIEDVSEDLP